MPVYPERSPWVAVVVLWLAGLAACSRGTESAAPADPGADGVGVAATPDTDAETEGTDEEGPLERVALPGGFAISHPPGWQLKSEPGRTELQSPDGSEFVLIQALAGAPAGDGRRVLQALVGRAAGPMRELKLAGARGTKIDAQARLIGAGPDGEMTAHALVAIRGAAATLFLIGADSEDFADALPELVAMLRSFSRTDAPAVARTGTGAAAPASVGLRYRRVQDAREGAFSAELPEGWNVELAMHRSGVEPRPELRARSPQGDVLLFQDDRELGTFSVPNPLLQSLGFAEGSLYDPGGGRPMRVQRYLSGEDFLKWWLPQRFAGARILRAQPLPELAARTAAARYRYGNATNASLATGEVDFEYQGQRGRARATTELYGLQDSRAWAVIQLHGYLAEPASEPLAAEALAHTVATTSIELPWLQRERRISAREAQQQRDTMQHVNAIYRQTAAVRTESSDRNARVMGDLLSGTFRVVDPTTGESGTVQAGSNYYYRVPRTEAVIGMNVDQGNPVDLTPLIRLDWDQ